MSADFHELIRRVEDMIVRQEILIAEIIARDRDPADAFQLLKQMEDLVRAIHESIALFEARRH